MTTNIWLNQIMEGIPAFLGVYSSDNIITPVSFPSYCIVNFSPESALGTHFITIIYDTNNSCIYYDPLNLAYIPENIVNHIKSTCKHMVTVRYAIQNPLSIYCGFFCLLIILIHLNNLPLLRTLQEYFTPKCIINDIKCISVICKLFELYFLSVRI